MRIFYCILGFISLLKIFAAPVGNPSAPKLLQEGFFIPNNSSIDFRLGYFGDFVTDGRFKQFDEGHGRVDSYSQNANSATLTLNFVNRLDVYGVLGAAKSSSDWRFTDAASFVHRIELDTEFSFFWGAGARAILYEWGSASLGLGSCYFSSKYTPKSFKSDGILQPVEGSSAFWNEWQVNLDTSYKIDLFIPYIGFKYSQARAFFSGFSAPISQSGQGANSFKNRSLFGLYLGCSITNGDYFMFNLEGRLIDEEAVSVSADFRF
jgi:hypothetical protein